MSIFRKAPTQSEIDAMVLKAIENAKQEPMPEKPTAPKDKDYILKQLMEQAMSFRAAYKARAVTKEQRDEHIRSQLALLQEYKTCSLTPTESIYASTAINSLKMMRSLPVKT